LNSKAISPKTQAQGNLLIVVARKAEYAAVAHTTHRKRVKYPYGCLDNAQKSRTLPTIRAMTENEKYVFIILQGAMAHN